jgi:hypothetical protein
MHTSDFTPPRRSPKWGMGCVTLLLVGCCAWAAFATIFFEPLLPWMANILTSVHGKAEVIAPAQWRPGGILSPDGRYMSMGRQRKGEFERVIWNIETGEEYPLNARGSLCWLDNEHFLIEYVSRYYIVQAKGALIEPATYTVVQKQLPGPEGLRELRKRWQQAEQIYVVKNFQNPGYMIVTTNEGQNDVYRDFDNSSVVENEAVATLLQELPYIHVPDGCRHTLMGDILYSPDGQYYLKLSNGDNAQVQIYNRDGEMVADAWKNGWTPRVMGWAHDSSGVYFQMLISGGAAGMMMPAQPIFKLSPYTPEEARWASIRRIALWVGAPVLLIGLGWWWWRKRRKRSANAR